MRKMPEKYSPYENMLEWLFLCARHSFALHQVISRENLNSGKNSRSVRIQQDTEELISLSDAKSNFFTHKMSCCDTERAKGKQCRNCIKKRKGMEKTQAEKGKNRGELE